MPYLQALTNNYFGAMPGTMHNGGLGLNAYPVSSSEAATIFPGDICVMTSIATVKAGTSGAGAAALASIIGIAQNQVTAAQGLTNPNSTGVKALIYDDPDLIFTMSNTTSGRIDQTLLYHAFNICGTGPTGSTGVGASNRSVMAISGITASSAGSIKVIALHPVENNYFTTNATGNAQKFLCVWNANHLMGYSTTLLTT